MSLRGLNVVFTGFRDKKLQELVGKHGGIYHGSFNKDIDIVVVGGPKGVGSNKTQKAIEMGKIVVSIGDFSQKYLHQKTKTTTKHIKGPEVDCPKGEVFNPRTLRCSSLKEIGTRILPKNIATKTCKEGKVVNSKTGYCVKAKSSPKSVKKLVRKTSGKICKPGKVVSPKTGRCIKRESLIKMRL
jgi:hypothetical protein